ncbi:hypothetical protein RF11_02242 [Thelohanellus kitauei]|uniref:Uncharacterized protein n=1 Tax=Thelohanellus kitauei TaxID=669202 RepID=A0A0C2IDN9_THEKT|nr:hypothetical protein RF11_02242 [Thelohanellus kitauei]
MTKRVSSGNTRQADQPSRLATLCHGIPNVAFATPKCGCLAPENPCGTEFKGNLNNFFSAPVDNVGRPPARGRRRTFGLSHTKTCPQFQISKNPDATPYISFSTDISNHHATQLVPVIIQYFAPSKRIQVKLLDVHEEFMGICCGAHILRNAMQTATDFLPFEVEQKWKSSTVFANLTASKTRNFLTTTQPGVGLLCLLMNIERQPNKVEKNCGVTKQQLNHFVNNVILFYDTHRTPTWSEVDAANDMVTINDVRSRTAKDNRLFDQAIGVARYVTTDMSELRRSLKLTLAKGGQKY